MSGSSSEIRRPFALIALACAMTGIASTFMPWATGFRWSELGVERIEGLIVLVAAINAALVAALGAGGGIGRQAFARWALTAGGVMLIASLWFRMTVVGDADPVYDGMLINCFSDPCGVIEAGFGLVVAVVASAGYLVAATISCAPPPPPRRSFASNWPLARGFGRHG
ncbi:MAG: hypothetical protein WD359_01255 [Dehalococcoidia bacterium]